MAGDWIKMRSNLWDDPRVARLCDITDHSEAAVVGALYWLWAAADQHSEDGIMPGLTLRSIDRKTGVAGFGEALVVIGWLSDHPEGVRIVRFEEHNGSSAKRRCTESKRKVSARDADKLRTDCGSDAEESQQSCAPRERGRERGREDQNQEPLASGVPSSPSTTTAGLVCARLRQAGVAQVNPSNPKLLALLAAGLSENELADIAAEPGSKGKGFAWVLAAAEGRRRDAANIASLPQARAGPSRTSRADERQAVSMGLTGRGKESGNERDITGEVTRVA